MLKVGAVPASCTDFRLMTILYLSSPGAGSHSPNGSNASTTAVVTRCLVTPFLVFPQAIPDSDAGFPATTV